MGHALRKDDPDYRLPVTLEQVIRKLYDMKLPEPLLGECFATACRKWLDENPPERSYVIHDYAYSAPSMRA